MRALFEFVAMGGGVLIAVSYATFVVRKMSQRGHEVQFVGGPLDYQKKIVPVLSPVLNITTGTDFKGNKIIAKYKLDEQGIGVYDYVGESIEQGRKHGSLPFC